VPLKSSSPFVELSMKITKPVGSEPRCARRKREAWPKVSSAPPHRPTHFSRLQHRPWYGQGHPRLQRQGGVRVPGCRVREGEDEG
jgi:hypothetical protein